VNRSSALTGAATVNALTGYSSMAEQAEISLRTTRAKFWFESRYPDLERSSKVEQGTWRPRKLRYRLNPVVPSGVESKLSAHPVN